METIYFYFIQKGNGLSFNETKNRWVDLGFHTEACITKPDTCTNGGAVAFWLKVTNGTREKGIISTRSKTDTSFLYIYNHLTYIT